MERNGKTGLKKTYPKNSPALEIFHLKPD